MAIARDHLQAVADRDLALLREATGADEESLHTALALIRGCNPRPGSPSRAPRRVRRPGRVRAPHRAGLVGRDQPGSVPRLRVNQDYASLVTRSGDYASLRAQLQEARWLIRSLEIRKDTLLRVARTIVQRQSAFLERATRRCSR